MEKSLYWLVSEVENSKFLLDYLLSHKSVFDLEMIGEDSFDRYRVINKVSKNSAKRLVITTIHMKQNLNR